MNACLPCCFASAVSFAPASLARTRFKPSLLQRFPRFRQSKTPFFGQLSTPLIIDDTGELMNAQNRSKAGAVLSRPQRQNA
jgi:hypothetical protein